MPQEEPKIILQPEPGHNNKRIVISTAIVFLLFFVIIICTFLLNIHSTEKIVEIPISKTTTDFKIEEISSIPMTSSTPLDKPDRKFRLYYSGNIDLNFTDEEINNGDGILLSTQAGSDATKITIKTNVGKFEVDHASSSIIIDIPQFACENPIRGQCPEDQKQPFISQDDYYSDDMGVQIIRQKNTYASEVFDVKKPSLVSHFYDDPMSNLDGTNFNYSVFEPDFQCMSSSRDEVFYCNKFLVQQNKKTGERKTLYEFVDYQPREYSINKITKDKVLIAAWSYEKFGIWNNGYYLYDLKTNQLQPTKLGQDNAVCYDTMDYSLLLSAPDSNTIEVDDLIQDKVIFKKIIPKNKTIYIQGADGEGQDCPDLSFKDRNTINYSIIDANAPMNTNPNDPTKVQSFDVKFR